MGVKCMQKRTRAAFLISDFSFLLTNFFFRFFSVFEIANEERKKITKIWCCCEKNVKQAHHNGSNR